MSPAYVVAVGNGSGQASWHNTDLLHIPVLLHRCHGPRRTVPVGAGGVSTTTDSSEFCNGCVGANVFLE